MTKGRQAEAKDKASCCYRHCFTGVLLICVLLPLRFIESLIQLHFNSFNSIHCRHLYSASSSGTTQKRSQHGQIMLV